MSDTLYADLVLLYMGRSVTYKGDVEGHPFHGNQYGAGQGGGGGDSGSSGGGDSGGSSGGGGSGSSGGSSAGVKAPPPVKVYRGYRLHDQFTNRKGNSTFAIQAPENESDKGWMITRHSRVDNRAYASFGKPYHSLEQRDTKENILRDFATLKRQIG